MTMVDLRGLLAQLVSTYENPLVRAGTGTSDQPTVMLVLPENGGMRIRGNEGRLAQVFQNLIGNALSFSPRGGTVAVRIQRDGDHAVVKVEDQGPGIPEGKLEAVFERFYSERPKHEAYGKHSGLGLSISKQIIDAHHGRIWAENIRGEDGATRGARFCVALPTVD
jgi:two-component system sensor histidine kinase ChvG